MTEIKKQEIFATICSLLERLSEDEPEKEIISTVAPDTVEMLTIKECTNVIKGLNEYTIRRLVARNELPYIRCGEGKRGKILIPKSALIAYFSGRKE